MANSRMNINKNDSKNSKIPKASKPRKSFKQTKQQVQNAGRSVQKLVAGVAIALVLVGGLLGYYNQRATVENILTHIEKIGGYVGNKMLKLLQNEEDPTEGKVKVTDDGIYIDGKEPPKEGAVPAAE